LSEKQYRDNCNELDDCAYWDIEIVTAIVKVIVHELHLSNIHVIVESQDRNDWNTERPYPSNSFYLQPSIEFLIVIYLQSQHHQHYVLYCFDLNEGIASDPEHGVSLKVI
jgi:hypothetical protein